MRESEERAGSRSLTPPSRALWRRQVASRTTALPFIQTSLQTRPEADGTPILSQPGAGGKGEREAGNASAVLAPERSQVHQGSQGLAEGLGEGAVGGRVSLRLGVVPGLGDREKEGTWKRIWGPKVVWHLSKRHICPHLDSSEIESAPSKALAPHPPPPCAGTHFKACTSPLPNALGV